MDVKSKKFNILACCAAGNGCCQLVSLKVKRVFTKLGLKCNVAWRWSPSSLRQNKREPM